MNISNTTTLVVVQEPLLRLTLTPCTPFASAQEALEALVQTLESHTEWRDPFSLKLFQWGFKICEEFEGKSSVTEEIATLMVLLRNPLDGTPLRSPWLAGGEIWEEWMLDAYISSRRAQRMNLQSPSYPNLTLEDKKVHSFALAMLKLVARLPEEVRPSLTGDRSIALVQATLTTRPVPLQWMILYERIQGQIVQRELEEAALRTQRLGALPQWASKETEALRQEVREIRESSTEGLERIREEYRGAERAYGARLQQAETALTLEQQRSCAAAAHAAALEGQVASLRRTVNDLNHRVATVKTKKNSCAMM